jgi:hypothetical protein
MSVKYFVTESELRQLATWLAEHGVLEAVMESTAQYWKPVWQQLEGQCELYLAQAFIGRRLSRSAARTPPAMQLVRTPYLLPMESPCSGE